MACGTPPPSPLRGPAARGPGAAPPVPRPRSARHPGGLRDAGRRHRRGAHRTGPRPGRVPVRPPLQAARDNPVDGRGVYVAGTPLLAGVHINEGNGRSSNCCARTGACSHSEKFQHSYPHCWRHKTPLIFRATPQWFISLDQNNLREASLAAITGVQWIPRWGEERIEGMVAGRPDWCISRQRTWGVPIPPLPPPGHRRIASRHAGTHRGGRTAHGGKGHRRLVRARFPPTSSAPTRPTTTR